MVHKSDYEESILSFIFSGIWLLPMPQKGWIVFGDVAAPDPSKLCHKTKFLSTNIIVLHSSEEKVVSNSQILYICGVSELYTMATLHQLLHDLISFQDKLKLILLYQLSKDDELESLAPLLLLLSEEELAVFFMRGVSETSGRLPSLECSISSARLNSEMRWSGLLLLLAGLCEGVSLTGWLWFVASTSSSSSFSTFSWASTGYIILQY